MNLHNIVVCIFSFLLVRFSYLYVYSHVKHDALWLNKALLALIYAFMFFLAISYYYGGRIDDRLVYFSSTKDYVFVLMLAIPIILTIVDIVKSIIDEIKLKKYICR